MAVKKKGVVLPFPKVRGPQSEEPEPLRETPRGRAPIDASFLLLVVLLLLFGLVMLYSASYATAAVKTDDSLFFIKKQLFSALLGMGLLFLAANIPYALYRRLATPILVVGVLGLVAVLFIGSSFGGAKRWIFIGPLNFQPSEIAKLALIIYMAAYITRAREKMRGFITGVAIPLGILAAFAGLMLLEPHLSGTIIMTASVGIMVFVGGAQVKHTILPMGIGGGLLAIFAYVTGYAKDRLDMFVNPWLDPRGKGFQIIQSLYAIGSGGLAGVGIGQSRQKFSYIPEPYNDFIFSILSEELGFIGAFLTIILFAALILRGFQIAWRVKDRFASLLTVGIMSNVAVQVLLNIAVVSKVVPVTGISLPFFSYGGSSLLILLAEMGVVLGISRYAAQK